jgi:hypothetical protein
VLGGWGQVLRHLEVRLGGKVPRHLEVRLGGGGVGPKAPRGEAGGGGGPEAPRGKACFLRGGS